VAQIRELAKARARLLTDVPRDVLMARFLELAAYRHWIAPGDRGHDLGFRLVRTA